MVRHEVFVVGQGVPAELEQDGRDPEAIHLLAERDGVVVGTARLRVICGKGKAERVAVIEAHRGCGAGVALMDALEREAAAVGLEMVVLHAQAPVVLFYERLGYAPQGASFEEAGIPHRFMAKPIGRAERTSEG